MTGAAILSRPRFETEGHALIDDEELDRALMDKQPFASCVVTRLCFDADEILGWSSDIRHRGIRLPVYVGLPGVVDRKKLLQVSLKVGVGDSARFLKGRPAWLVCC
jgi:methylenetetrahydrofolate reductase (NADPH)